MNMHGIIAPASDGGFQEAGPVQRIIAAVRRRRMLMLVVALPTLLVAAYLFLVAADQYESEAHFMVRTAEPSAPVSTGINQVLSLAGGASANSTEVMSVGDYLTSHDAVSALNRDGQLVERFRRREADIFSRLAPDNPTPETLLKYYRRHVLVHYSQDTGITTLIVRGFRPADSYAIVEKLLKLGEQRVNYLNVRGQTDALAMAQRQLADAEEAVAASQTRITAFRQSSRDIDPQASGEQQIRLVSSLQQSLSAARAQLASMQGFVSPSSPQYISIARRVQALAAQVGAQTGRMAGNGERTMATGLGTFEELRIRQEFAAKRYDAAAAAFQRARDQTLKQQLYLVRVVEPNMPVKSTYPERWRILATVFVGLLLTYAIGWLIAAGVREHAS